jgi:hypothetical protein
MADQAAAKRARTSVRVEAAKDRPFRVKLRGSVVVVVQLPGQGSIVAAFHVLSTTGGVIHVERPLGEKLEVELTFRIQESAMCCKAVTLFPTWATEGWMQPFRFADLSEASRSVLDAGLKRFLAEAADEGRGT